MKSLLENRAITPSSWTRRKILRDVIEFSPCRETNMLNMAAVEPYHFEPERVPEDQAPNDNSDASEKLSSLK